MTVKFIPALMASAYLIVPSFAMAQKARVKLVSAPTESSHEIKLRFKNFENYPVFCSSVVVNVTYAVDQRSYEFFLEFKDEIMQAGAFSPLHDRTHEARDWVMGQLGTQNFIISNLTLDSDSTHCVEYGAGANYEDPYFDNVGCFKVLTRLPCYTYPGYQYDIERYLEPGTCPRMAFAGGDGDTMRKDERGNPWAKIQGESCWIHGSRHFVEIMPGF